MNEPVKKIIFFIDDDEDDFFLMKDIFNELHSGIDLVWIKDGEEAVNRLLLAKAAGAQKPHLILLDLNMPKLNGREVLKQLRGMPEIRHIPVVVLTNSMNKDEATDAYRLGANSFMRKPSGYKELRDFSALLIKYWFEYSTLV